MIKPCDALLKTSLFEGLERSSFHNYCSLMRVKTFSKGEIIAAEGDACTSLAVIQKGQVAMQKYTSSGDFATIGLLVDGDFFGEDLLFGSSNHYSFTLEAVSLVEVLFISKDTLSSLMDSSPVIMNNYLRILSDCVHVQNYRIALLSQKTIRQKIAYYLLDLRQTQDGIHSTGEILLPGSKEVISKLLAMPRPSFSRELIAMEKDGLIAVDGRKISLLDVRRLENDIVEGYAMTT
ncbi:MAG TPA: Crp/Fnr family transcriptional regulator [Bacillota bacterium]|nr:Crp/Fnr family transcriptional regulator [Bacillota bacterium]